MGTQTTHFTSTHQGYHLKVVLNPILFSYKNTMKNYLDGVEAGKSRKKLGNLVSRMVATHGYLNDVSSAGFDLYHEDNKELIAHLEEIKSMMPELLSTSYKLPSKPLYFDNWG